jgi:hypothetical protein
MSTGFDKLKISRKGENVKKSQFVRDRDGVLQKTTAPLYFPGQQNTSFPHSTYCVRGFNVLKLYLFFFCKTDSFSPSPPS